MPASPDTPHTRALKYSDMLTDFALQRFPPAPDSPAPAWLTTAEGMAYMQAMTRGDVAGALRIFVEAGERTNRQVLNTMFDDIVPGKEEPHG